jgi:hypothetical protein
VLVVALVALLVGLLLWNVYKRRRKYYAGRELANDELELGNLKFTYREIEYRDLKLGKLLGEGAFGKVYKGEYRYSLPSFLVYSTFCSYMGHM